jgi:hypothetical protein
MSPELFPQMIVMTMSDKAVLLVPIYKVDIEIGKTINNTYYKVVVGIVNKK